MQKDNAHHIVRPVFYVKRTICLGGLCVSSINKKKAIYSLAYLTRLASNYIYHYIYEPSKKSSQEYN